jgi:DNA-binding NarL/FixJ family response regulator
LSDAAFRIIVADGHAIVRRGLMLLLAQTDDLIPAADAGSSDELFGMLRSGRFDLVIMNLSFASSGLDVLRGVRKEFPRLPVLILNYEADDLVAMRVLRAGASGYIQRESAPVEFLLAIRRLLQGHTYVSPVIAEKIARELAHGGEGEKPHERLSGRESEVFQLLASGKSVGEIAQHLDLSVKTVSTHRGRVLEKTGLRNNAEIMRYALLNHLI